MQNENEHQQETIMHVQLKDTKQQLRVTLEC